MADKLIIHFRGHSNELVDWALVDSSGKIIESGQQQPFTKVPKPKHHWELIALIPAKAVTLTKVEVPKASYSKLIQALPYAVEANTATKLEQLHFALGCRNSDETLNIAYVNNLKIGEWLKSLDAISQEFGAMYSEASLLPLPENGWSLLTQDQIILVRTGLQSGFACDSENLLLLLPELVKSQKPSTLYLYNFEAESNLATAIKKLVPNVTFEQCNNYFEYITPLPEEIGAINLLQNRYRPKTKFLRLSKPWRITAQLFILWLFVIVFGHIAQLGTLKYQKYRLDHKITDLYQQLFPNATSITNPRAAFSNELQKYQAAFQPQGFIYLTGKASTVIHANPPTKLENIQFHNNSLTIKLTTSDFSQLDKIVKTLQAENLKVKRDRAQTMGKVVEATLIIGAN